MDFRNKYLKYKPEITFDIFQEVWDKLIESGYLPIGIYDAERGFGDFKTLHCYLRTTENHPMKFNCYSVIPALFWVETTVQEILGYDPFVKDDDFVLPEKWCCKITEESIEIFNNWRISISKHYLQNKIDKKYPYITNNGSCNYTTMGIEITFDQFKKYVLKQDVQESTKIDYYRCIKADFPELVLGKIYPSYDCKWVKIPNGEYTSCFDVGVYRFELSTKSDFDAQNQPKQPIKQAVLCETQEQWDFVTEKLGYEWNAAAWTDYGNNTCVNLEYKGFGTADVAYIGYQILSFSDWCAQSNYEFLSTEDKYKEVLRKNARTLGGEVVEIDLADYDALLKNMFDFNVSEQTANNLSENIDRVRYRAMQTAQADMLENNIKSYKFESKIHIFEISKMGGFKIIDKNYELNNKNKVQISTDNEIKINITQKQSIKI